MKVVKSGHVRVAGDRFFLDVLHDELNRQYVYQAYRRGHYIIEIMEVVRQEGDAEPTERDWAAARRRSVGMGVDLFDRISKRLRKRKIERV